MAAKILFFLIGMLINVPQSALTPVSVANFADFVAATQYVTDAEKYGWSVVQIDVFNYEVVNNATWRMPDGKNLAQNHFPVTQVSFNDALAYCQWANKTLPDYETYWQMVQTDTRPINEDTPSILPLDSVNIVGNVWDITYINVLGEVRLAGGSYLCNKTTCNGTSKDRELFVDALTGNSHIGFSVITKGE